MLPPAWQTVTAAFATNATSAMHYQRGIFLRPVPTSSLPSRFYSTTTDPALPHFSTISPTVDDTQTRYREHFCRVLRMPVDASVDLVDSLRPRLPRRGLSPACRTAIALWSLGGGSYLDFCAAFRVYPSTMYRALWEVVDAVIADPPILSSSPRNGSGTATNADLSLVEQSDSRACPARSLQNVPVRPPIAQLKPSFFCTFLRISQEISISQRLRAGCSLDTEGIGRKS